jgi:hypothetical protein
LGRRWLLRARRGRDVARRRTSHCSRRDLRILRGPSSIDRFHGSCLVDHALEQTPDREAEARRLGLDPGAPLVVEPDANNGGLGRRHDSLTVMLGVYIGGAEWWQPGGGRNGGPCSSAMLGEGCVRRMGPPALATITGPVGEFAERPQRLHQPDISQGGRTVHLSVNASELRVNRIGQPRSAHFDGCGG